MEFDATLGGGLVGGPLQVEVGVKQAASMSGNNISKVFQHANRAYHHFKEAISPSLAFEDQ